MNQFNYSYEFPSNFRKRVEQILQQINGGSVISSAFQQCKCEHEDVGLAYYAGLKGDNWNKKALDITIEGSNKNISRLKTQGSVFRDAIAKALRSSMTGYVLREILFIEEDVVFSSTDEERLNADIKTAYEVLSDLLTIGERLCTNATYRQESSENSINDFIRDAFSFMGYSEVKDQTRHGLSSSGKDAGEVDLLITKNGKEVAIIEGLKLDSVNSSYIDTHIDKAIANYNALGTATFIVAYVSSYNFESFWNRYTDYLREYPYPLQIRQALEIKSFPNAAIRIASMILSRYGYDFPVFFLAINLN